MERRETDVAHFFFAQKRWLGEALSDCEIPGVGVADALPASEKLSPATPNVVTAAALVARFRLAACFARGMVASSVGVDLFNLT